MKILLVSIGTRWDMEPFLAIGKMLERRWHTVACAFPDQFKQLTQDAWFEFFWLWNEFLDMIQSQKGREFIGWEVWIFRRLSASRWFLRKYNQINTKQLVLQKQAIQRFIPDRVVHHCLASYPVIWWKHNPHQSILLSTTPYLIHATSEYSHIVLNKNWGSFLNRLSYPIMNYILSAPIMRSHSSLDIMQGIPRKDIEIFLRDGKTIYTVSPSIFKKPEYWPQNVSVVWFSERDKQLDWRPSAQLETFLASHDKILFVSFGSMTNAFPKQKTSHILAALQKLSIPAIINTYAWGLEKPNTYNQQLFHFVASIPYDFILPKIFASVHHGWAGTTHMSLRYGKPNLIIPHILDQFFWNTKNHSFGTWPKGMKISTLSAENFEKKVSELWNNTLYKIRAEEIWEQMQTEDFEQEICEIILS
jgi:UDP:flavonoid glycosyltransferase YjiC (YdhE family)